MSEQIGAAAEAAKSKPDDLKRSLYTGSQSNSVIVNNRLRSGSRPRDMVPGQSFQGLRPHHNLVPSKAMQSIYGSAYMGQNESMVQSLKKKEKTIESLSKKLQSFEKKNSEEMKVSIELKKRHDVMQKKMQIALKDKVENQKQLKALYAIFQKQRKALELSIKKNRKYEQDIEINERQMHEKIQQNFNYQAKVEAMEQQREMLQSKHQREIENLNLELQEKKMQTQRLQNELAESSDLKHQMKGRIEEYEDKIKKLIKEFEDESKKHIKEVNDIHEHYRSFKSKAQELEHRIDQYKKDCQLAQKGERLAKKELIQITFENDELDEKVKYLEQKYHALVKRMGASQEDIDNIEEDIMQKGVGRRRGQTSSYNNRKSRVSGPAANKYKDSSSQPYDEEEEEEYDQRRHMGGYNQNLADSGPIVAEDIEQELDLQTIRDDDRESQNQSRLEHRQGKSQVSNTAGRRGLPNNAMVDSYEIYGENQLDDSDIEVVEEEIVHYSNKRGGRGITSSGNQLPAKSRGISSMDEMSDEILISGEQVIEPNKMVKSDQRKQSSSQAQRKIVGQRDSSSIKKTQIEVLDNENPIELYQQSYKQNLPQQELQAQPLMSQLGPLFEHHQASVESDDLFGRLIYNIRNTQALQNVTVSQKFKLHLIKDEEDLQNYKNLLNAMAAMFYSGHSMKQQQQTFFYNWISLTRHKLASKSWKDGVRANGPAIVIDTELANRQYENQAVLEQIGDEISPDKNMIHIEGEQEDQDLSSEPEEEDSDGDPDTLQDNFAKGFIKDLLKVGPISKQILNYSYPPLLYQRGDDSEEESESEEEEQMDSDEDDSHNQFALDDDFNMNIMGQDLDDLDMNNADLRQHDQQIDEFFAKDDQEPEIDVSDIQKMINKSGQNPSNMMDDMNFNDDEDIDFYNNLKRVVDDNEDNEGYQMDDYEDIFDDDDDLDQFQN